MKTIKLFTATLALISSVLCVGCDAIKSLADVDLKTNTIVDIPVQLVNSDMQSCEFSVSLADIDELSQYLDKLEGLSIEDIEMSILNYDGDEFSADLTLSVDDAELWSKEGVNPATFEPISLKSDVNLNEDTMNALGFKLLSGGVAKGRLEVESTETDPVSASFTVRCKFLLNVTANALE